MDVRSSRDGHLILLHDQGLERLAGTDISNIHVMSWEDIKNIDIGTTHPNRCVLFSTKLASEVVVINVHNHLSIVFLCIMYIMLAN